MKVNVEHNVTVAAGGVFVSVSGGVQELGPAVADAIIKGGHGVEVIAKPETPPATTKSARKSEAK